MAKKVGICDNCDRNMYTNDFNLCKRCHQDVGYSYFQNQEAGPSLSDLGLDDTISPEAPSAEEVPEPEVKEESLEIKKAK